MGDVILIAPLIAVLRKRYVDAEIVLLTQSAYACIFKEDKRISRVIGVKKGELSNELTEYGTWNIIIDLQNSSKSRRQIGILSSQATYYFDKLHTKRTILLLLRHDAYGNTPSIAQRYLESSGEMPPYGVADFRIPFTDAAGERFMPLIQQGEIARPVIALFPYSAWRNKEWPEEYFVSIGQFFLIKGWNVLILGGKADRSRAEDLERQIGYRCISLAGRLDLFECGSVVRQCNLALGCDTGLSHLARACQVKCGFIFGPTTRHFGFQPENDKDCRVFEVPRICRPCHPHGGNVCLRIDHGCMRSITPDMVISGLLELYHG